VTGHLFALPRAVFERAGGMDGLGRRFDDDHEIARRVRALGLRCVQTPLVYTVENALPTLRAYRVQMRRWFVMPKQAMAPYLTARENAATVLFSAGNLLPPALLAVALAAPGPVTLTCAALAFALFAAVYAGCEARYLPRRTPARGWAALPWVCFVTPLHVLLSLALPGDRIEWRGLAYRARRGGAMEAIAE
jgi:ceramide glucosyltransferase